MKNAIDFGQICSFEMSWPLHFSTTHHFQIGKDILSLSRSLRSDSCPLSILLSHGLGRSLCHSRLTIFLMSLLYIILIQKNSHAALKRVVMVNSIWIDWTKQIFTGFPIRNWIEYLMNTPLVKLSSNIISLTILSLPLTGYLGNYKLCSNEKRNTLIFTYIFKI